MKQHKPLIILFILILALPTLDSIFNISPISELFEKRIAKPLPPTPKNTAELTQYPKKFEAFYNDNYGFRKTLISLNSAISDKIFNESPDERAVIGKNGWLYFDNKKSLLDAVGKATISDVLVNRGVEAFAKNWQDMKRKNIKYLLIIAADKSTIYPEFLPDYLNYQEPHRIDIFLKALKSRYPDFPLLDLRPMIKNAKNNHKSKLYYQTDTHWNMLGAHIAYQEIMKTLFIKPHPISDYDITNTISFYGDIAQIINSNIHESEIIFEPKFPKTHQKIAIKPTSLQNFNKVQLFINQNKNLPTLFVYKDSFFGNLINLMPTHFSKSIYINEFPCNLDYQIIQPHLNNQNAQATSNIVIQQFWESRIEDVLNECK